MSLFLDKTEHADWSSLIDAMPDKEFLNVTRSSLPLMAYWMKQRLDEETDYHFEFTVPSVARARPSHTDLMMISDERAIAVEGKSTEPRYETVSEWSARPGALRSDALAHWVALIAAISGTQPSPEAVGECVYQMIHRLASVCSIDRPLRGLTYQVFDVGGDHDFYRQDLEHVMHIFELRGKVSLRVHWVETQLTPDGEQLRNTLPAISAAERAPAVRQALTEGRLFKFGSEKTEVIDQA